MKIVKIYIYNIMKLIGIIILFITSIVGVISIFQNLRNESTKALKNEIENVNYIYKKGYVDGYSKALKITENDTLKFKVR